MNAIEFAKHGSSREDVTTGSGRVSMPDNPWPFPPKQRTATTLAYLGTTESLHFDAGMTYGYIKLTSPKYRWMPNLTLNVNNLLNERGVTQNVTQGSDQRLKTLAA